MGKLLDISGNRYGRLIVIKFSHTSKSAHMSYFECKCDCGNTKIISGSNLKKGRTRSCGCLQEEVRKTRGERSKKESGVETFNTVYRTYKTDALSRNLCFEISEEEFLKISQLNCYYCNCEPSNIKKSRCGNGDFIYNGIDRINNEMGYILENCVPSCRKCNSKKSDLTEKNFLDWVKKVYEYRQLQNQ